MKTRKVVSGCIFGVLIGTGQMAIADETGLGDPDAVPSDPGTSATAASDFWQELTEWFTLDGTSDESFR